MLTEKPGNVDGRHYSTFVEEVKQFKRENRLAEAEVLLLRLIEATECETAAHHWRPAPWYYRHLAIVYRKMKKPEAAKDIEQRLAKAEAPFGEREI